MRVGRQICVARRIGGTLRYESWPTSGRTIPSPRSEPAHPLERIPTRLCQSVQQCALSGDGNGVHRDNLRDIVMSSMLHILVVDDSSTIRRMVKVSLSDLAGELAFHEAASGLEAIEKVVVHAIGLVILDLNMPDMHGLEVLDFLRGHQRYQQVPIIVLTTRGDDAARESAFRSGATSFMTKPFKPTDLRSEADRVLTKSGMPSEMP